MSGIRPPDCSKLAKNPKNDNDVTIFRHDVNVKFFWRCFVSLVKFSYWSKFHVNIITSTGIVTILFYKGLARNPEIRNTPVWALPNIWRLGGVVDTKFRKNVSNRILLKAAKLQGYSFYRFWVIKGKPTGARVKLPPTQIRVNIIITMSHSFLFTRKFRGNLFPKGALIYQEKVTLKSIYSRGNYDWGVYICL